MIFSQRAEPENEFTRTLGGVYAHGKLETFLSYDVISTNSLEIFSEYTDVMYAARGRDKTCEAKRVEAQSPDGKVRPAFLFMWRGGGLMRGLLVAGDDVDAIEYALIKCKERTSEL